MNATKQQIRRLQAICARKGLDREDRLEMASEMTGSRINSFLDLTVMQAEDLIHFLNYGKTPDNISWGRFRKDNPRHMTVLSRCKTLGWIDDQTGYADLNRLDSWLKSNRSPVQKPLLEMEDKEVSKIIAALDSMIKKYYK